MRLAAAAARSANTRAAYASYWRRFEWCGRRRTEALPVAPATIAAYLAERAETAETAKVRAAAAAIAAAHWVAGALDPTTRPVSTIWAAVS